MTCVHSKDSDQCSQCTLWITIYGIMWMRSDGVNTRLIWVFTGCTGFIMLRLIFLVAFILINVNCKNRFQLVRSSELSTKTECKLVNKNKENIVCTPYLWNIVSCFIDESRCGMNPVIQWLQVTIVKRLWSCQGDFPAGIFTLLTWSQVRILFCIANFWFKDFLQTCTKMTVL